jgi:hypothetical protein
MKCRECHTPLALDIDVHLQTWLAGTQIIPPKSQISALQCPKCEHLTCVGCGSAPKLNKHHFFTPLGVVRLSLFFALLSYDVAALSEGVLRTLLGKPLLL